MSDDASARLGLPYLAAGQLQKHVTLNEALTCLDALTQTAVVSRTATAQPAAPADGALYILPTGATGADWRGLGRASGGQSDARRGRRLERRDGARRPTGCGYGQRRRAGAARRDLGSRVFGRGYGPAKPDPSGRQHRG